MIVDETLVVGDVSRANPVVHVDNQARMPTANATRRLDVLGTRLRLRADHHKAETINVNAHRDHVGCQ